MFIWLEKFSKSCFFHVEFSQIVVEISTFKASNSLTNIEIKNYLNLIFFFVMSKGISWSSILLDSLSNKIIFYIAIKISWLHEIRNLLYNKHLCSSLLISSSSSNLKLKNILVFILTLSSWKEKTTTSSERAFSQFFKWRFCIYIFWVPFEMKTWWGKGLKIIRRKNS